MKRVFLFLSLLLLANITFAGIISGTVYDENNEPMPGTTIYVVELKTGTASNMEGRYELNLDPGTYTVIYRFIGYKTHSRKITIGERSINIDIQLTPQAIILKDIEILAGKEDPAYPIMRKAISKAGYYRNIVDEYKSRVYTKGTGNVNKIPFLLRKKLKEEGIDTSRYFVSESVTDIRFKRPSDYEEKVVSIRSSGDDNNTSPTGYITASFYEPEVAETISPLHPKAFSYYKYEYLGSFFEQGHEINRIKVIARSTGDHLFNGEISIVENDWGIHSLKLLATKLGIEFNVDQLYQEYEKLAWLPITHKFKVDGKVIGIGFTYEYLASVNYDSVLINRELQPKLIVIDEKSEKEKASKLKASKTKITSTTEEKKELTRKELKKQIKEYEKSEQKEKEEPDVVLTRSYSIDSLAYKRDSGYWNLMRPVPLTKKEMSGYRQIDSLAGNIEKDTSKAARKKRAFSPLHLLTGKTYRINKKNIIYIRDAIEGLGYNTVEGINLDYSFGYRRPTNLNAKNPNITTTYRTFIFDTRLRYSLAREKLLPYFSMSYSSRKRPKRTTFSLKGGSLIYQFNQQTPIHPTLNALYTLFMEENYMKLYQADEYLASLDHSFNSKWRVKLESGYQYRRGLQNNSAGRIIDWKDKDFTDNDPVNDFQNDTSFPDHNHYYIKATLVTKPWMKFRIRNKRRIPINESSPTMSFSLQQAIPNAFNGQTSYLKQTTEFSHDIEFDPLGTLNIVATYSSFLSKNKIFFMDRIHFNGNQTIISPGNEFRQLSYYQLSTDRYALGLNTNFKFKSNVFLARLPFLSKKGVKDFAVFNALHVPGIDAYLEVGYGLDYLFRFMRIEAVASFLDGTFEGVGIRIGLPPDINID